MNIEFELNGQAVSIDVNPGRPLREVLREEFGLTGVKVGCESGRCGVCTTLLDGEPVKSCLVMASKADGRSVTTVEGVSEDDDLHEVQEAFKDNFASQCGYCTPGFVMSSVAYLEDDPEPDREEIAHALKGNVCRCTGYEKIIDAVESVATERSEPSD